MAYYRNLAPSHFFQTAPKNWRSFLWGLVGFRLLFPFSIPNPLSPIPYIKTEPALISTTDPILNGMTISSQTTEITETTATPMVGDTLSFVEILLNLIPYIWTVGVCCMFIYAIIAYIRLHKKTKEAVLSEHGYWICDKIESPFIMGIFNPKILLPSTISENTIHYVTSHEQAHLKRFDHWRKLVAYIILSLHWFNPFVWVSFFLFCRDTELACDEKATKNYEPTQKADYTQALLHFSTPKNTLFICPFSFGESSIKERIKSVLNYKKPSFWLIFIIAIATIVVSVFFFNNSNESNISKQKKFDVDSAVSQAVLEYYSLEYDPENNFPVESHIIYGTRKKGNRIIVYAQAYQEDFTIDNPLGIVESYGGCWCPCAITFELHEDNTYTVLEYWEPDDGSLYTSSIMEKFPTIPGILALITTPPIPTIDMEKVHKYFNTEENIIFISPNSGHLFNGEDGDTTLTFNTSTNTATLSINGKTLLTDSYHFDDTDIHGNEVPFYIFLCDVDNLPNNKFEYDFTVVDKNTLCVTSLKEKPIFKRVDEQAP